MGSFKIKFFVGEPEKRTVIQIQREGCRFYRMELDKLLLHWRQTGKISETTFRKIAYDNAAKLLGV